MQAIDAYLRNVPPGYALLLSGPWGAGKSFFWSHYSSNLSGLRPITISAAGLQSSADLEDALFTASIAPLANSLLGETSAVIGKALLRVVKIDPKDISFKADIAPGKSVVCIDDVERFAGPFSALFGFVVNLLDASGIHCILIADEGRAVAQLGTYADYKERIVGKTIVVTPTVSVFCDEIVKGFSDAQSRRVLGAGLEQLVGLITGAKLVNLRTVRFFLTELEAIVREIPEDAAGRVMSSSLPSAVLFWSAAIARSPDNARLVERAFQGDVGLVISMVRMNRSENAHLPPDGSSDEVGRLSSLLDELGLADAAYGWPESKTLISIARGSEFDPMSLVEDFHLRDGGSVTIDDLELLRHHYEHSDSDVQEAVTRLRAAAIDGAPAVLMRFFQIFRTINYLAEIHITSFTPEEWIEDVLTTMRYWRDHPDKLESGEFEAWPGHYSSDEKLVIDEALEVSESVKRLDQRRYREAAIEGLLTGVGYHPQDRLQVIFAEETDAGSFLTKLKASGAPAIQRVSSLFRSHLGVINAARFVGVEARFARQLANGIRSDIVVQRPMPILDAELLGLARLLLTFANKMEKDIAAATGDS